MIASALSHKILYPQLALDNDIKSQFMRGVHKLLTYQFNVLCINVIMSPNRDFACIIPCVVAVHFFEMEITSGISNPIIFLLIHPGICRRFPEVQNFDSISFPCRSWVRISRTMTNNVKILFPTVQFNCRNFQGLTGIDVGTRKV